MELELTRWILQRASRQPMWIAAWLGLAALPWLLAVAGPLGPDSRSLFSKHLIYEVAFLWGLLGGLAALAALGEITVALAPLSTMRRLRAHAVTLAVCIVLPALPIVLVGLLPTGEGTVSSHARAVILLGAHLVAIGMVTAQLPAGPMRGIAFVGLAWLVPALVSDSIRGIVVPVLDATRHLESTSGSSAWPAAFAPILALVLTAIGVDVIRRPAT